MQGLLGTALHWLSKITTITWYYTIINMGCHEGIYLQSSNCFLQYNWYSWKFLMPTFFLLMTIFPYTRMSLKRKNCRAFGFFRHILVRTPSPTSTRPGTPSGYKCKKKGNHKSLPISYRLLLKCLRTTQTYIKFSYFQDCFNRYEDSC